MMSTIARTGWIVILILVVTTPYMVSATTVANSVIIIVKDLRTKTTLDGALVYLDGGYQGTTSSGTGTIQLQNVKPGTHTLRVTKPDYKEVTRKFSYPEESTLEVTLSNGYLVSMNPNGPSEKGINVVFYPSSTSYSCSGMTKLSTPLYMEDETRFRQDVQNVIDKTYLNLELDTSKADPLPANYKERFNFYYYYNPSAPADAFFNHTFILLNIIVSLGIASLAIKLAALCRAHFVPGLLHDYLLSPSSSPPVL